MELGGRSHQVHPFYSLLLPSASSVPNKARYQISNFTQIYYNYADSVILGYLNETEVWRISRAKIEMQILKMVDQERIPVAYRLAMFCTVCSFLP